jgi:hypothetical protein
MISFTSSVSGNSVVLKWATATETNNRGFSIERSSEKGCWEQIGFVSGNGTTTSVSSYLFKDDNLNEGTYYYRLKQTDYDGSFEYSNEIEVQIETPFTYSMDQNYPNPFNPATTIRYSVPQNSLVSIKVINIIGQEVAELVNEVKPAGQYEVSFEANGLASGIYLVKMQSGDFTSTRKMTLLK